LTLLSPLTSFVLFAFIPSQFLLTILAFFPSTPSFTLFITFNVSNYSLSLKPSLSTSHQRLLSPQPSPRPSLQLSRPSFSSPRRLRVPFPYLISKIYFKISFCIPFLVFLRVLGSQFAPFFSLSPFWSFLPFHPNSLSPPSSFKSFMYKRRYCSKRTDRDPRGAGPSELERPPRQPRRQRRQACPGPPSPPSSPSFIFFLFKIYLSFYI